jgi:hypothetical protein
MACAPSMAALAATRLSSGSAALLRCDEAGFVLLKKRGNKTNKKYN